MHPAILLLEIYPKKINKCTKTFVKLYLTYICHKINCDIILRKQTKINLLPK